MVKDRGISRLHRFPVGGNRCGSADRPARPGYEQKKARALPLHPQKAYGCSCRGPEQHPYITLPLTLAHRAFRSRLSSLTGGTPHVTLGTTAVRR